MMTTQDLIARLTIGPGDFVTLNAEEAAQVREVMQRRIPITVDLESNLRPEEFKHPNCRCVRLGFDQDAR